MNDPTRGALRWARSATMTAVIVGLAATAHVLAGGALPSPLVLIALTVATACVTHTATRRRLRTSTVLGLLVGGELLLHGAFETFAGETLTGETLAGSSTVATGHQHSTAAMAAQITGASQTSPMEGMSSGSLLSDSLLTGSMLTAHAVATLVTGLALAHGERTLWALLAWITPLVQVLRLALLPVAPRVGLQRTVFATWRPHALVLARNVARRGPPALPAPA